jgi:hypothetical protein
MIYAEFYKNGCRQAWCNFNHGDLSGAHAWIDQQFEFFETGSGQIYHDGKLVSIRSRMK